MILPFLLRSRQPLHLPAVASRDSAALCPPRATETSSAAEITRRRRPSAPCAWPPVGRGTAWADPGGGRACPSPRGPVSLPTAIVSTYGLFREFFKGHSNMATCRRILHGFRTNPLRRNEINKMPHASAAARSFASCQCSFHPLAAVTCPRLRKPNYGDIYPLECSHSGIADRGAHGSAIHKLTQNE